MRVYRIERQKYLSETLTGKGASLSSAARWNSEGVQMVYTSESRSLAMLEILVHLNAANLPDDRYLIEIEIPDDLKIKYLTKRNLPDGWHVHHVLPDTQKLGDDFIADRSATVLKVPSAIVPHEYNYLINPNHPDSRRIKIRQKHRLVLDPRLLNMFK